MDGIVFDAAVYKVQTLVDGGLRVTFDLPETAIEQVAALMRAKRDGIALRVACVAQEGGNGDEAQAE